MIGVNAKISIRARLNDPARDSVPESFAKILSGYFAADDCGDREDDNDNSPAGCNTRINSQNRREQ